MDVYDIVFQGGSRLPYIDTGLICEGYDQLPASITITEEIAQKLRNAYVPASLPYQFGKYYKTLAPSKDIYIRPDTYSGIHYACMLCDYTIYDDDKVYGHWSPARDEVEQYWPTYVASNGEDISFFASYIDPYTETNLVWTDRFTATKPWHLVDYDEYSCFLGKRGVYGYGYMMRFNTDGRGCGHIYVCINTARPITAGTYTIVSSNCYIAGERIEWTPFEGHPFDIDTTICVNFPSAPNISLGGGWIEAGYQIVYSAFDESSRDHKDVDLVHDGCDPIGSFDSQAGVVDCFKANYARAKCPSRDYVRTGGMPFRRVYARELRSPESVELSTEPGSYFVTISGYMSGYYVGESGSARCKLNFALTGGDCCDHYGISRSAPSVPIERIVLVAVDVDVLILTVDAPGDTVLMIKAYKIG